MMRIHIGHHFYGAGNFGDDLIMAGFLQAWGQWGNPGALTCSIPFDRVSQQRRFPQVAWLPYDLETRTEAIRHCSIWLGVGGPAFETDSGSWMLEHLAVELELCQRFHKPMFFLCVGVSNREALEDARSQAVLDYAEHIWTRDEQVAERLRKVCRADKVTAGADLAHLYLAGRSPLLPRAHTLGWLMHFDDRSLVRPAALAQALARLTDWEHYWLVQEVRDLPGSELATLLALPAETRNQLTVCLPDYSCTLTDQLLHAWPACEAIITSRFHGVLISAWRGTRVVAVERNDKLRGVVDTLGCHSIPAAHDADALCQAIASSVIVERDLLERQLEIAWGCCVSLFRLLHQGNANLPNRPQSWGQRKNYPVASVSRQRVNDPALCFAEGINEYRHAFLDSTLQKGGFFMASGPANVTQKHYLTADEIEQFHWQGFLGPFTAFSAEAMAGYRQIICERVLKSPSPYSAYPTQVRHLDSQTVWRLCSTPAIVDRLVSLYGPDLILWYSNFFDKGPARPSQQEEYPWHQDMWHWKLEPLISLSVWLAITPATVENGCVEVIPGTHTQEIPIIQRNDANLAAWFGGQCADPNYFNESDKVAMVMEPGQFFLFNEATLHHSNPNRTQERRLGLSFRVTLPRVKLDRSYPCLILSGRDRIGLNPIAPSPTSDPDPLDSSRFLPDAADFCLDQPLYGLGWHLPECDNDIWFRWTGPETNSWLDLDWKQPGDGLLRCQILYAIAPHVLESLQIRVNGHPIPLLWQNNSHLVEVEGRVPAEVFQQTQGWARVSFHVAETLRFCDLQPTSNDTRQLGLAISRISLVPVGSLPPTAELTDPIKEKTVKRRISAELVTEADRTAKEEVIQSLRQDLQISEADRTAKEEIIHLLQQQIIQAQQSQLAAQEAVIHLVQSELTARDRVQTLGQELAAKEEVIQELDAFRRVALRPTWSFRSFYPVRHIEQLARNQFSPRIGVLYHYPPIPLKVPEWYTSLPALVSPPTLSIVTPSFNQADYLERTVKSVLDQHYPALEYIIQDGGSTDDTPLILEHYQDRVAHFESKKDKGQAHALNLGFARASGEIMAWLNSDDLLLPGTLNYVANFFAKHPKVDVVYGHRVLIDENDGEIGRWILPPHDGKVLLWADYIPQETLFWRRRIWEKAGGCLDESFQFALDWELLLRFQAVGVKMVRLPHFLGAFRVHAIQKTSTQMGEMGKEEMDRLRQRSHGRSVSSLEINRHIRPYLARSVVYHKLYRLGVLRY